MTTDTDNGGWTAQDRAQVEQVFGLTGGELADTPWIVDGWTFTFWYEFPPEYAEREFDYTARNYRTAVRDIMFGAPPDRLGTWTKVATFQNSGEAECPGKSEDIDIVRVEQCGDDGRECYYCGGNVGAPHGYVYLGDGWAEIVYVEDETAEVDE